MTTLLVDDDVDALALLQMVLERRGVESVTAASVAEARAVLAQPDCAVDVVVTDFELQDGIGLDLHAQAAPLVRAFVVLTGHTNVDAPPGVKVLRKPLDIPQLLALIAK